MYKLFYNLKVSGDVLYIIFDQESKPDKVVTNNDVTSLYKDGKLIGINIFNISNIAPPITAKNKMISIILLVGFYLNKLLYSYWLYLRYESNSFKFNCSLFMWYGSYIALNFNISGRIGLFALFSIG